jgi:hypothetical protein
MKKIILFALFILTSFCLTSCDENKVYPLERVEIWENGTKISWRPNVIVIGSTYTFTAKFFNSKSQETQVPRPENILWTANEATASSATLTPHTGVTTSYVMTAHPGISTGKIKVEYENLTPYEITVRYP